MDSCTSNLKKEPPTHWIFQEGCIKEEIAILKKRLRLQERDVCEIAWYKIMGIFQ
jgi:hypothetical protein